jgi:cell division protein FtsW
MYLSKVLSKKQDTIKSFKQGFLPCIIPVAIICILIMPANLSNALLTGATSMLLMFIGRVNTKYLLAVIGIAALPVIFLVGLASEKHKLELDNDYKNSLFEAVASKGRIGTWVSRVEDFMYPSAAKKEITQRDQANMAIANGSIFFGLGPGNSVARNFLPQAYNDFIFAVIIEEYGLLGAMIIMFIYILFLFRCIRIFRNCPYAFGAFLTIGLSFTLMIQALANMAVSVGVVPVTGVTLPLVSMGGSSFLFTCASIGIILSVGRQIEKEASPISQKEGL